MTFRAFIRSLLREPSAQANDPYGWLTNQLGHVVLGYMAVLFTVFFWRMFSSEYPSQIVAAIGVLLFYIVVVELLAQGWRGVDTLTDIFFVGWGASIWLVVDMAYVLDRLAFHSFATLSVLSLGVARRVRFDGR